MEFWGVEVKSGTPLKVKPGEGMVIHLSQASLGEVKANKTETATLFVSVDGKKLVLGTLLSDKLPQQLFDLVFDRDFELSHNLKSGSISFFGYKAANPIEEDEDEGFDSDDSEEEDISLVTNNGQPEVKANAVKPVAAEKAKDNKDSGKHKVKIVEPTKDEEDDDSEDDDSDEDGSSDGDLEEDASDSDDEDSDEDDTPKKEVAPSKKRGPDSAIKTPTSQKKAKLVTPQKTDGKKSSGHVATPYPSKQPGKTPKANQQSPKSGGSFPCGPCNKTFNSEVGLASHTKAKHSSGK